MKCCGLERDSRFCPKCGKELKEETGPVRWVKAERHEGGVTVVMYPDRHRIPVSRLITFGEAMQLRDELRVLTAEV